MANLKNIEKVLVNDPYFPECFKDTPNDIKPVKQIYFIGDINNLNNYYKNAISIVGSRMPTSYGLDVTWQIASELAQKGWTIVSGGAIGIDSAAHKGTLAVSGKTVVFIAGGLHNLYPRQNYELFQQVVNSNGLIISESPLDQVNHKYLFLERNRLIALYSKATVVVEAAWRSGALSTAAYAEKLLKNVAAVPGLINSVASSGTNELIRNSKATLVSCADDILELVNPINPNLFQATDKTAELVLAAIPKTYYISVDKIIAKSALSDLTVMGCLPRLEMLYLIQTDGIGWKKL